VIQYEKSPLLLIARPGCARRYGSFSSVGGEITIPQARAIEASSACRASERRQVRRRSVRDAAVKRPHADGYVAYVRGTMAPRDGAVSSEVRVRRKSQRYCLREENIRVWSRSFEATPSPFRNACTASV